MKNNFLSRNLIFAGCNLAILSLYLGTFQKVMALASNSDAYSFIPLIPLISAFFLIMDRKEWSPMAKYSGTVGLTVVLAGSLVFFVAMASQGAMSANDHIGLLTLSALISWTGCFMACYGVDVVRNIPFPFIFLIFAIPFPDQVLAKTVSFLQLGSATLTDWIFTLTGISYLRDGLSFHLPGLSITVAPECSGIRSSMALIITVCVAGHMFLDKPWKKLVLLFAVIPISLIKNAVRISTLSLLGTYVDKGFIDGPLHHKGGIVFFILALFLLVPLFKLLKETNA